MLKNYVKIALRSLLKDKIFSGINILGLALGLGCCILISLYTLDELSYDRHHRDPENLYRVATEIISPERHMKIATSPAPLAPALKRDLPEVEAAVRVMRPPGVSQHILRHGERQFVENSGLWVDADFFQLFSYDFLHGNPMEALRQPNCVVLSDELANKLFGEANPVGQTIEIDDNYGAFDYQVTGVFKQTGFNSHLEASFLVSLKSKGIGEYAYSRTNWAGNNFLLTYIRTRPGTQTESVQSKFPALLAQYAAADLEAAGFEKKHFLQPVPDIHLHSGLPGDGGKTGSIALVYTLSSIAILVLLVACINYMNLSTAKSTRRAREIGVRKVLGSQRSTLALQFICESVILTLVAAVLVLVALELFLPKFNQLIRRDLSLLASINSSAIAILLGIVLITGIAAGSYPAFFLSSFAPVRALQGEIAEKLSARTLRKVLVAFQFVISISLIIGIIVISRQLSFMQNKQLGFAKEQRLVIPFRTETAVEQQEVFKQAVLAEQSVRSATATSSYPSRFVVHDNQFFLEGNTIDEAVICKINYSDHDVVETFGYEIVAGRDFSKQYATDISTAILVNEATLKSLGLNLANAVGARLNTVWNDENRTFEIVGVVRDFHYQSLHEVVRPFVFLLSRDLDLPYMVLQLETSDYSATLTRLEQIWQEHLPQVPFEFSFLDEQVNQQYQQEQQQAKLVGYFTILAIFIACLGLYGLASFTAARKTKEIGIRKVLGASVASIVSLLSRDFLKLVVLANLIAWPVAWFAMQKWLENYAYRVEVNWWTFVIAGSLAFMIALLTVSAQSVKAALANPASSLRDE